MKADPSSKEEARRIQSIFFAKVRADRRFRFDSEIADAAGISRPLFSMMKDGKKPMSLNSMVRIARVFGLKVTIELTER